MFKTLATWWLLLSVLLAGVCAASDISIIPKPQQMEVGEGSYRLDAHTGIVAPGDARSREIASFLRDAIHEQTGIAVSAGHAAHGIALRIDSSVHGDEAYRLEVTPQQVTISAATDKGLFWGVQTLRQLLPPGKSTSMQIPAVRIEDAPAFAYRGFMLDVGRHFYPVAFIEKQLDLLSYYKINVFHWHLTDDQGWRIQIKRYPKLTEVGAWRTEADGSRYGGFYTQAQIRDVVAYARRRNIMVIPEIEMPGHSMAALAAYPELSCTGKALAVPTTWGVFKDIDCVGDAGTFTFLQNVLDEVLPLFPAPWVHIGGDEVPKDRWHDCASCQQLMHAQGFKDEDGLQSYFIQRIQRYLAGKGKTLMGWDEILEGGASQDAIIEIWRGDDEARKALVNGNRIIVAGPFYLDSPPEKLTVEGIYRTNISGSAVPADDSAFVTHRAQILGAEAPLWSERANPFNAEPRMYPRLQAFAENLWSGGAHDEAAYGDFQHRLQAHYPWLDAQRVAYGPTDQPVVAYTVSVNAGHDGWQLHAKRGFDDLQNHYTTNGREPTAQSPSFGDTVDIRQAGTLKVAPFRRGLRYDNASSFMLKDSLALGRPITFTKPASSTYAPGSALVDGVSGSDDFHDGRWAAWHDSDLDATIDLQQNTTLHSIDVGFLQATDSRILLPQRVTFSVSLDGKRWTQLHVDEPRADLSDTKPLLRRIEFSPAKPVIARYIRVVANKVESLPATFPGGNKDIWLFADEIRVR
ncbi:glycoside hydrolase family 20 protein [Rhodanobacter koreensis]